AAAGRADLERRPEIPRQERHRVPHVPQIRNGYHDQVRHARGASGTRAKGAAPEIIRLRTVRRPQSLLIDRKPKNTASITTNVTRAVSTSFGRLHCCCAAAGNGVSGTGSRAVGEGSAETLSRASRNCLAV